MNNEGITVLSICDGISSGQIALERAGIKVKQYISSEIKESAIKVTQYHYPNTLQIGDVNKIKYENGILYYDGGQIETEIDIVISGTPCQDFSSANRWNASYNDNTYGLKGDKSSLFYQFLRLLDEIKPKYFFMENVKMKKKSEEELNEYLGVKGLHIDSNLVSYQNRHRIYWTNIPNVTIPENKHINFQDFKEVDYEACKPYKLNPTKARIEMWNDGKGRNKGLRACANITYSEKINCLTRKQDRSPNSGLIEFDGFCRYLTRKEIELAQTLPIGYTDLLSYRQMQDVCGDGWTVDVITYLFGFLKKDLLN